MWNLNSDSPTSLNGQTEVHLSVIQLKLNIGCAAHITIQKSSRSAKFHRRESKERLADYLSDEGA